MRLRKEVARVATRSAVYLSLFSMICPWASLHAANLPPTRSGSDAMRPVNQDIALSSDGVLVGTIHTADGMASSGKSVVIQRDGQLIAEVKSDAEGRFIVAGLSGGVYQVDIGGQPQNYRMWTADSAPPVAQPSLIVQEGQPVVRGQMGCGVGWAGSGRYRDTFGVRRRLGFQLT